MRKPSKEELLTHYRRREPKRFIQLDGHADSHGDTVMAPDEAGDALTGGHRYELMLGCSVRVLIPDETDEFVAVRLLRKIIDWIERDGFDRHRYDNSSLRTPADETSIAARSLCHMEKELNKERPDLSRLRYLVHFMQLHAPAAKAADLPF